MPGTTSYNGGIITLRAIAFSPEDAQLLASLLLRQSEKLINRMNERANSDAVSFAEKELSRAESMVVDAQRKITEFRNRELILDPVADRKGCRSYRQADKSVADLQRQLTETLQSSPSSPTILSIQARIRAYNEQIATENSKIVGTDKWLALKVAPYERLVLDRQFVRTRIWRPPSRPCRQRSRTHGVNSSISRRR